MLDFHARVFPPLVREKDLMIRQVWFIATRKGLYGTIVRYNTMSLYGFVPGRAYESVRIVPYLWANLLQNSFKFKVTHSVIYRFTRLVNRRLPEKFHVSSMLTEAAILIQSLRETPYALTVE